MALSCWPNPFREFTVSIVSMLTERRVPALRPNQLTWAVTVSPPVGWFRPHHRRHVIIIIIIDIFRVA